MLNEPYEGLGTRNPE